MAARTAASSSTTKAQPSSWQLTISLACDAASNTDAASTAGNSTRKQLPLPGVAFHDAEHRGQAQTAPGELGGKKRVEHLGAIARANAGAGVLHFHEGVLTGVEFVGKAGFS